MQNDTDLPGRHRPAARPRRRPAAALPRWFVRLFAAGYTGGRFSHRALRAGTRQRLAAAAVPPADPSAPAAR